MSISKGQRRQRKLAEREQRRARLQRDADLSPLSPFVDVRQALATKLNGLEPGEVVWQYRSHEQVILERGTVHAKSVESVKGRANQCHESCATLFWLHYPAYQIATGYAYLRSMGRWVRHSWLVDDSTILESTHPRDIYFGTVLEGLDQFNFVVNQTLSILQEFGMDIEADQASQLIVMTPACQQGMY